MRTLTLVAIAALWVPNLFSATSASDSRTAAPGGLPDNSKLSRIERIEQLRMTSSADTHRNPADGDVALAYEGSTLWCDLNDMAVAGDYAYCAMSYGLMILDIRTLSLQPIVSKLYLAADSGYAGGVSIALSGSYAYLADIQGGLVIIDVTLPQAPHVESRVLDGPMIVSVAVVDTFAYVTSISSLYVVDVADPAAPAVIGSVDCLSQPGGLAVDRNRVYVADGNFGFKVINIADPHAPYLQGQCPTPGIAHDVVTSGRRAWVADGDSGLKVIDVLNPAAPFITGGCGDIGFAYRVAVSGGYAYIADMDSGLQIIDIATPTTPHWAAGYHTGPYASGIELVGRHALLFGWYSLLMLDIGDPLNPVAEDRYDMPGNTMNVAVSGNYAYAADHGGRLSVVDITSATDPTSICSVLKPASAVAVRGQRVFFGWDHLFALDVSNPYAPSLVCSCQASVYPIDIVVEEKCAYVADLVSGLTIINTQDCSVIGSCPTLNYPRGIAVQGDYAYMASGDLSFGCLQVLDITTPSSPQLKGTCMLTDAAWDVAVSGRYAFVASYFTGLHVIDVRDPMRPVHVFGESDSSRALGIAVSGNYAFVAKASNGTVIYDISDPRAPQVVGSYRSPGAALKVAIAGNRVYVADQDALLVLRTALCGDVDGSGQINLSDAVYLINYIFGDGEPPVDARHGDIDCDGATTIADAVYLVNYIFGGGAEPCVACK